MSYDDCWKHFVFVEEILAEKDLLGDNIFIQHETRYFALYVVE